MHFEYLDADLHRKHITLFPTNFFHVRNFYGRCWAALKNYEWREKELWSEKLLSMLQKFENLYIGKYTAKKKLYHRKDGEHIISYVWKYKLVPVLCRTKKGTQILNISFFFFFKFENYLCFLNYEWLWDLVTRTCEWKQ